MSTVTIETLDRVQYLDHPILTDANRLLRLFLLKNGYATRFSVATLCQSKRCGEALRGDYRSAQILALHDITVPRSLLPADVRRVLNARGGGFSVFSLSPLSVETATKCLVADIYALPPAVRDAVFPGLGGASAPALAPARFDTPIALAAGVSALPPPDLAPLPDPVADERDPALNDIVARRARAAYFEQIDYLISSALEAKPSAPVVSKLNAALAILRDLAPSAI